MGRTKRKPASDLSKDLCDLLDKHTGQIRYTTRDPSGKPKVMIAMFGPKTRPTHRIEVEDYHQPEDPLERKHRQRKESERKHERRRQEIQVAVDNALREQKAELTGDTGDMRQSNTGSLGNWSKASLARQFQSVITAGSSPLKDTCVTVDKNVLTLVRGEQTFKITVSMPRKKKK